MLSFGWSCLNEEVAAVASFVRNALGNRGIPVAVSGVESGCKAVKDVSSADKALIPPSGTCSVEGRVLSRIRQTSGRPP